MRTFHLPYQARIILGFAAICLLIGLLSLSVGISIINRTVFNEARSRVSQDLNSAWEIFLSPLNKAVPVFELATGSSRLTSSVNAGDTTDIVIELDRIKNALGLSFT
ncbi:MAG: hypothetical protein HN368_15360, partial [Spirochaetales bacterium]|nr:hypothetical protein [Spirochaetales bacterium]